MYIRTTCGVLGILKHIKLNMYEFNNERYIKNGIRLHNSNHDYTIKLQEDEFIDVLEKWDILKLKDDDYCVFIDKVTKKGILLPSQYVIKKCHLEKYRVVTHEQYLPLAQEVL